MRARRDAFMRAWLETDTSVIGANAKQYRQFRAIAQKMFEAGRKEEATKPTKEKAQA